MRHAAHVNGVGEEVGCVCNEEDETAFRLGVPSHMGEFQE